MWGLVEFYFPTTYQIVPLLFVLKFILSSTELLCIFIKSNMSIHEWSSLRSSILPFDLCFYIFPDTTNSSLNYCNSWNVWIGSSALTLKNTFIIGGSEFHVTHVGSQDSFVGLFLSSHLCVGSGDLISLSSRPFTVWLISRPALFQTCFSWVVAFSQWYNTCLWCSQSPGFKSQHQHMCTTMQMHIYTHKYIDHINTQRDRHTHRHTRKHTYHIDTHKYTHHRHRHTKTHTYIGTHHTDTQHTETDTEF